MSPPDFQSLKRKKAKFQVENIYVGGNKKNYAIRARHANGTELVLQQANFTLLAVQRSAKVTCKWGN